MAALLRFGTKVAIAGGAIYITLNEGVWSSGSFGSRALERVKTNVLPTANQMVNQLPSYDNMTDRVIGSWNKGVEATFTTLSESPHYVSEYSRKTINYVREKME